MTRKEFYLLVDEVTEAKPGTVKGEETLKALSGWDSLAAVSFIALVDERLGLALHADQLSACKSVPDLAELVSSRLQG